MPLRSTATIRQRRLAKELQRLREAAAIRREDVAEQLDWHHTKLYRIENARSGITPADMRHLLDLYKVKDQRHRAALIKLARNVRQKGLWTAYRDVFHGSHLELEAEADSIRTFEPIFVPGLFQTERYARAMIRANLVTTEIERRVEARMERQRLLDRDDAPKLWMVIEENALTRPVGGADVMREQLDHLMAVSEQPRITLQVVRTSVGAHPGMGGSFVILDFPNPDFFAPVVFLETDTDGLYLEEPEEIARYTLKFDHLRAIALGPDESVRYIQAIKDGLDDE